ncbi:peptidoglycan editing factor PgeF [uncultured Maricaulis sp.]|uniref:peptidoglycan editing factor PgeF n=1 Tax=uncultured Maricaulis sp. TaxID=174710 RepID=UPI0030DC5765|tara:strand:+ start:290185 stop:290967 length:783 start_codon:yes stop_codon:yes gene_type:complete
MSLDPLTSPLLGRDEIVHAFTTRAGGVSEGAYASLNMTRSRGDSAEHVATNRERVRQALGLDYLVFAIQVHGRAVVRVDQAPKGDQAAGEADAMITDKPGIGLVCQTADCTPILLFDPERRAVAAIHSGWRSTVLDIVTETVAAMVHEYGTDPANLIAAIGPAISAANYRVGPEVVAEFEAVFADTAGIVSPLDAEGGAQLDVGEACRRQLLAAGIPGAQIERSPLCTYAEKTRLFSARRSHHCGQSGVFGGQAGIIGLR